MLSLGAKQPDSKVYHLLPSSAGVKNGWNYTSTPLYAFMAYKGISVPLN